jgi:YVTN family beta-propeller protein
MIEVEGRQFRADREVVAVPGCPCANAPEHRGATGRQVHRFGHLAEWPPLVIAITPNGKTAYVANGGSGTVTPIRTATSKAGKAIRVGGYGAFPINIAITPNAGSPRPRARSGPSTSSPTSVTSAAALAPLRNASPMPGHIGTKPIPSTPATEQSRSPACSTAPWTA